MKPRLLFGAATLVLGLVLGAAPAISAQSSPPLSEKDAKKLLKKSNQSLNRARKAAERGDASAAAEQAGRYTQHLERLSASLVAGNLAQDDVLAVAARVDEATLKHIPVLEGLLGTVPDQARPAIERALQVSRRGHDTATEAILRRGEVSLPEGMLTDRTARGAMERNEALLDHAERARKRGENATVRRSVDQYTANMDAIGRAIEQGAVDEAEAVSVLDRVDRNTRRHVSKLEELVGQVPEQARPAIERAIRVSQRGNQAAVEALARTPAAGIGAGRPGSAGPPSGIGGRPGETPGGPPSGKGKPPTAGKPPGGRP